MTSLDHKKRIFLSPPHMSGLEQEFVREAFASNYVAPLGPQIDAFEVEFASKIGSKYAVALSSCTAAIHLALVHFGIGPGDEVIVPTFTFAASSNPVVYQGGRPVFIDSEALSWNMDPSLLEETLRQMAKSGKLPKAVIVVHLYGQCANLDPIMRVCADYGVPLIEDAAEALGASYKGRSPGIAGKVGVFSFNGNKIITTSGGGMLVSDDEKLITHVRKLSTQARDPAPYYQHSEIGYNYRLSNILAAIGRGQLRVLDDRVRRKRELFDIYRQNLGHLTGLGFSSEASWGKHNRWLTTITISPKISGTTSEKIRLALENENIESRPLWKPMHVQPLYKGYKVIGGSVSEEIFRDGLCLPSGTSMSDKDLERVISVVCGCWKGGSSD